MLYQAHECLHSFGAGRRESHTLFSSMGFENEVPIALVNLKGFSPFAPKPDRTHKQGNKSDHKHCLLLIANGMAFLMGKVFPALAQQ